jgi:hypothetical protein
MARDAVDLAFQEGKCGRDFGSHALGHRDVGRMSKVARGTVVATTTHLVISTETELIMNGSVSAHLVTKRAVPTLVVDVGGIRQIGKGSRSHDGIGSLEGGERQAKN